MTENGGVAEHIYHKQPDWSATVTAKVISVFRDAELQLRKVEE